MINKKLAVSQGLSDEAMKEIEKIHIEFDNLLNKDITDILSIKSYNLNIEEYEYKLQELWKFGKNKDYHTYWFKAKACKCPVDDNYERLGTPYKIYNSDCPLHGIPR